MAEAEGEGGLGGRFDRTPRLTVALVTAFPAPAALHPLLRPSQIRRPAPPSTTLWLAGLCVVASHLFSAWPMVVFGFC